LIIADIEGSSGCGSYRASAFFTPEWADACLDMSLDVDAAVKGIFAAGAEGVTVVDFHRTGYNLLSECIDPRVEIRQGYRRGPVPGLGSPAGAELLFLLGLHAASGTNGFLAHTMTSRIRKLTVNGRPLSEAELFSGILAPYGIRPVFFSGCPDACRQARAALPGISTFAAEKPPPHQNAKVDWRCGLQTAAARAMREVHTQPHSPRGPFFCEIRLKPGAARKTAYRWGVKRKHDRLFFDSPNMESLFRELVRIAYFTPILEAAMPISLFLQNLKGRLGLARVRRRHHREGVFSKMC
jgi:D-aminopeptidase